MLLPTEWWPKPPPSEDKSWLTACGSTWTAALSLVRTAKYSNPQLLVLWVNQRLSCNCFWFFLAFLKHSLEISHALWSPSYRQIKSQLWKSEEHQSPEFSVWKLTLLLAVQTWSVIKAEDKFRVQKCKYCPLNHWIIKHDVMAEPIKI